MSIEEKYNIVYEKGKRVYVCDLKERHWDMDNTVPFMISINGHKIYKSSWNRLIVAMLEYLDENNPKTLDEFLKLVNTWNGLPIFSEKKITNCTKFKNIYVNTNNNSHRSFIVVKIILGFYNIDLDNCVLLIRRHFAVEPAEVRKEIQRRTINDYVNFYLYMGLDRKTIDVSLTNIDQINMIMQSASKQFDNLYLFDDLGQYSNYKNILLTYIKQHYYRLYHSVELILEYLTFFYRHRRFFNSLDIENVTKQSVRNILVYSINLSFMMSNEGKISCGDLFTVLKRNKKMLFINPQDVFNAVKLMFADKYEYAYPYIIKK